MTGAATSGLILQSLARQHRPAALEPIGAPVIVPAEVGHALDVVDDLVNSLRLVAVGEAHLGALLDVALSMKKLIAKSPRL
jgi:hypothetical protein